MTVGNLISCLAFDLAGVHFRGKRLGILVTWVNKNISVDKSELKKGLLSDCKPIYMPNRRKNLTGLCSWRRITLVLRQKCVCTQASRNHDMQPLAPKGYFRSYFPFHRNCDYTAEDR